MRVSPKVGLLNKLWNFDLKNCDNLRDPANLDNLIKQRTKTADILGFLKVKIVFLKFFHSIAFIFFNSNSKEYIGGFKALHSHQTNVCGRSSHWQNISTK